MPSKFKSGMVSDAKRVVRGEHWLLARKILRRRDRVHHKAWTVLMLPGEHPAGEIDCIRELMPKAKIVAVDKSGSAVEAAQQAGADVAIQCKLGAFRKPGATGNPQAYLPKKMAELGKFDVVNLDLCCDVASAAELIQKYSKVISKDGVFMATFSYGRDVAELYDPGDFGAIPSPLGGRVREAARAASYRMRIASVLAYAGNQMPMCSCLWEYGHKWMPRLHEYDEKELVPPDSFARVGDDDLYAAVTMFDRVEPALLYALPAERVLHFRRKLAAQKAVATRRRDKVEIEK